MKTRFIKTSAALACAAWLVSGCQSGPVLSLPGSPQSQPETLPDATSTAGSVTDYKVALAHRISQVNSRKVYEGRPQALLNSVVVIKYTVDGEGRLVHSEVVRSNRVKTNETTAMNSLKAAAPFPKPGPHLVRHGKLELHETWLFNNDGRFQLRSIAEPQMDR